MFIDTNVLVSARVSGTPGHDAARRSLWQALQGHIPVRISRQIVREYLAVITRPQEWGAAVARHEALDDVDRILSTYDILEDGPAITAALVALCRDVAVGGSQIHDANIVATMLAHGERRLLTFNVADFRRYGGLIEVVDPGS